MVGGGLVSKASPATVTFAATLSMFTVVKEGVEAKACEPMLIIFLGIFTVVRPLFKKALFGMVPKPVPMVSVARRVLLAKQADPTLVTVLGIVRVVKAQLANAKLLIVVTVAGIVNAVSGQNSKAAPGIVVKGALIVSDDNDVF